LGHPGYILGFDCGGWPMTDNGNSNGHAILLDFSTKPYSEPVAEQFNGAEILDRVSEFIRRYVHLSDHQAEIVALWVAHSYALEAATCTPYLAINSAVKQCGKTRLLEVLELMVAKPWLTGRVTAACLIRKVDQMRPTLLLDESDAAFQGEKEYAEALRGILNTGFYAGGVASACVGQGANITFKDFRTFCPKAIAGIGQLPDTVADRSIPIRLQRKKSGEVVSRFRRRKAKVEASDIKIELSDWISSIVDRLKDSEPDLPALTDRQQDGVEPLLAIADQVGGDWPRKIRQAAVEIFSSPSAEDQNVGVQLLIDIRIIFDTLADDKITSTDLLEKLKEIETSPWADWSKGKGLTPRGLSHLLKPFGVTPQNIRMEDRVPKGYLKDSFADAWERYLVPEGPHAGILSATPLQPSSLLTETHFSVPNTSHSVTDRKSASYPHEHCVVADVADRKSPKEEEDTKTGTFPPMDEDPKMPAWETITLPCPVHGKHAKWWIRLSRDGGEMTCGLCQPLKMNATARDLSRPAYGSALFIHPDETS
jgi:hypothetical protein